MQQIGVVDIQGTTSQHNHHGKHAQHADTDQNCSNHGITSIKGKGRAACPPFCSFWLIGYKWILVSFLFRKMIILPAPSSAIVFHPQRHGAIQLVQADSSHPYTPGCQTLLAVFDTQCFAL